MENLETTKLTAQDIEKKVGPATHTKTHTFTLLLQVAEALLTEKKINEARENYRLAAARASLLYFILNDLEKINPLYQFSLKVSRISISTSSPYQHCTHTHNGTYIHCTMCVFLPSLQAFSVVFQKAIVRAEPSDVVKERVERLIDSITYSVFMYTSRGLFERDKLIFTSQVAFQVCTPSLIL